MFLPEGTYYISGGVNGKFYAQVIITKNGAKSYYIDKAFTIDGTETRVEVSLQTGPASSAGTLNGYRIYPMLVVGSTAPTKYESYKGKTLDISTPNGLPGIPVTSGGNYTDANGQQWICDEVDFARGVYVQRISKVDLGALSWMLYKDSIFYSICKTMPVRDDRNLDTDLLCSIYAPDKEATDWQYVSNNCILLRKGAAVANFYSACVKDTRHSSVSEFQNAVSGVHIYCVLATPIEKQLSETELAAYRALHTNKPNTTILNDSGAYMSVDYTADTKLYIDNKIKEALQ